MAGGQVDCGMAEQQPACWSTHARTDARTVHGQGRDGLRVHEAQQIEDARDEEQRHRRHLPRGGHHQADDVPMRVRVYIRVLCVKKGNEMGWPSNSSSSDNSRDTRFTPYTHKHELSRSLAQMAVASHSRSLGRSRPCISAATARSSPSETASCMWVPHPGKAHVSSPLLLLSRSRLCEGMGGCGC